MVLKGEFMIEGYILEARDVNGKFLAYFVVNESDALKAEEIVKATSMAESVRFVKDLSSEDILSWQVALKTLPFTVGVDLVKGKCMDLATWAHAK